MQRRDPDGAVMRILYVITFLLMPGAAFAQAWQSGVVTHVQGPNLNNCYEFLVNGTWYAFPVPNPETVANVLQARTSGVPLTFYLTSSTICGFQGVTGVGF